MEGNIMNKAQLIEAVANHAGLTKVDAEACINHCFETIKKAVKKGDDGKSDCYPPEKRS
jgi:nucleoid DNA-binding protein